jgi:hypothetical protein
MVASLRLSHTNRSTNSAAAASAASAAAVTAAKEAKLRAVLQQRKLVRYGMVELLTPH